MRWKIINNMKITRPVKEVQYFHNSVQKRMHIENKERNTIKNKSRTVLRTKETELPSWKGPQRAQENKLRYTFTRTQNPEFQKNVGKQIIFVSSE